VEKTGTKPFIEMIVSRPMYYKCQGSPTIPTLVAAVQPAELENVLGECSDGPNGIPPYQ